LGGLNFSEWLARLRGLYLACQITRLLACQIAAHLACRIGLSDWDALSDCHLVRSHEAVIGRALSDWRGMPPMRLVSLGRGCGWGGWHLP